MELISTGIFINAVKVGPGVWVRDIDLSRIFNHDETIQFINYGVDGIPNGLVYAGRGEACKLLQKENSESVTIHALVSFAGTAVIISVYVPLYSICNKHACSKTKA